MVFVPGFAPETPIASHHWSIGIAGKQLVVLRDETTLVHSFSVFLDAGLAPEDVLHLGDWHSTPCFAVLFPPELSLPEHSPFVTASLRRHLGIVGDDEFWLAGRAQQLAHWLQHHRFCGRCGRPNQLQKHERVLACLACGALYYPHVAPCAIGIVMRGDQCLLAHNANFAPGLYSVLAGFIEPGETAEQALIREIREETGITVSDLEYICSQPWPFPSQLMLGFTAQYSSGEIVVDGVEITDAGWFSAHDLPQVPPPHTISGKLIQLFIERSRK